MANDPQSSDKVDPLFDFLGISLCTRTLAVSKNALKPNDNDDLESLHVFMQSMALKSPKKHLEHAKEIVYRSTQPPNSEFASFVTSNNENEAVASNGKQTLPGRRPGLARKRPRFSMKPNLSQPSARSMSSLDIKQLDDPVEFFLAHERLENAEKELRRLRGESMSDLNDFKPRSERHRRPGLSGRSVSYKHLYPSILTEKNYATMPSQESLGEGILSPNYSSQPETVNSHVELQEQDLTGSIAATGNKGSALFDELLSDNCENLDGDEMKSFLQERLQIKPLHLENLRLPDFHDLEKSELVDLGTKLPKPRTSLLDRQNLEKGVSGEAPVKHKQVAKSPFRSLASPTSPNYLFASVSALKKRILQSNLLKDPVSALDLPPARSSSSLGDDNEPSNQLDIRNELIDSPSGSLTSLIPQVDDVRADNMGLSELITSEVDTNVGPIASRNDIRDSNRNESMAIRDSDAALSDVQNLVKGVSSEATVIHKQVSKSPSWSLASPTPPKSPFASICALKKHILRSNLSKDPFSALDLSPARNSSSLRDDDEPSNRFNIRKEFMDCSSSGLTPLIPEVDEVFTNGGPVASHDDIRDSNHSSSMGIGDTNVDFRADATTEMEKNASVSGHVVDEQFDVSEYLDANAHFYDKMQVGDVLQQAKLSRQVDGNVESSSWHHTDFQTAKSNESEENLQDENMSPNAEPPMNIDSTAQMMKKKDHLTVGPANIPDCIPMQHIQNIQEPVEVSPDEQSKAERPLGNGRKRKEVSRRQSLAAAGTYMESGVRRSRRIKMRPLEYWKGERFLYGRIHESLTTVIGVKYVSPAKGAEKSNFRVKSYVSDEYKELVDLAALH